MQWNGWAVSGLHASATCFDRRMIEIVMDGMAGRRAGR